MLIANLSNHETFGVNGCYTKLVAPKLRSPYWPNQVKSIEDFCILSHGVILTPWY